MGLLQTFLQGLGPHLDRALRFASSQMPGVLITRKGSLPYLWRFYFEDKVTKEQEISERKPGEESDMSRYGVFLHRFVDGDELDEVHSHPWEWCISFILTGGYSESRCTWELDEARDGITYVKLSDFKDQIHLPFSMNLIRHNDMHRVTLIDGPAWTLFFHGPRVSTWGFAEIATGKYREIKRRTASFIKQGIV